MTTIYFEPVVHQNKQRILLRFNNVPTLNKLVRTITDVKWSNTHKAWHIPRHKDVYNEAIKKLQPLALLQLPKNNKNTEKNTPIDIAKNTIAASPVINNISAHNLIELNKMILKLQGKAYSPSTIKTYKNEFTQLLKIIGNYRVEQLTTQDIQRYIVHAMKTENISENTAHSRINALKFYYEQTLCKTRFFVDLPRPKRHVQLPKLLNENELARLFNALSNKKHKAMLFTAYSAGLRVSEVTMLKIAHIDSKRMQIFIEKAKGKKDRYVNLSPVLLDILRNYIQTHKPKPRQYLFESDLTGTAYPTRTVQQIFTTAKQKAGIIKEVGIHSLRHSFATHLLDKGTDIRYIKELLGHFNIKTTERYLHVSKKQLVNIVSPLDDLWKKEEISW